MKVKELIELLRTYDKEMEVLFYDEDIELRNISEKYIEVHTHQSKDTESSILVIGEQYDDSWGDIKWKL